jgi:hypothetical protein
MKAFNRRVPVVVVATLIGAVIGMGADHFAFAQQPGIKRTELLRSDVPSSSAYEAVMAVAEIAPGAMAAGHRERECE